MSDLTYEFRGQMLRSVQANGLAVIDQHTESGTTLPRHHHSDGWFTFLLAGSYVERLASSQRSCSAGMVIWHPPGLVHENNFVSKGHNVNLVLGQKWMENLPADVALPHNDCSWQDGLPYRLGLDLYRGLNQDAQVPAEIVFELLSLCASAPNTHGQIRWFPRVLDWMNDEYSCTLTLSQASELAGVHPVHVSRSFRCKLGCSFHEHLTLIRIRRATDLLKRAPYSITEIALACGFSDHAHLTRTFKRATGLTPTAYRNQAG